MRISIHLALLYLILTVVVITIIFFYLISPVSILNAFITHKGYTLFKDISYGTQPRQKLDIYIPDKQNTTKTTLIYFYGGSWQSGDKNMYRFIGQAFASKGFITVIANYRLYPEVYFPAFVEDGAKVIHWVHSNIQNYKGSPQQIFLAGHSAGAQIAALLVTDEHYLRAEGGSCAWLKGMIGIAGPYDFLPFTNSKIKAIFSKVNENSTQPINFVRKDLPDFLLVSGDNDNQVSLKNTLNFAIKLRQYKVPVTEIIYPQVGHIAIILSLATVFRYKTPLLEDISQFIKLVSSTLAEE